MGTRLSIVIVNWNAGRQLADCVQSIRNYGKDCVTSVIIVDNASSDDSLAGLDVGDIPITVIRNSENRGFAAACNQGAAGADGEFVLFLNPDTLLFENSLSVPLAFMSAPENSGVGICGVQLLDESGEVARTCARFPTAGMFFAKALGLGRLRRFRALEHHMAEWDHSTTRRVDQLIGAFFFVRRSVFEALQGFDERFFVYFEEVDFSYRARKAGWASVYLADAQAFHAGGGTSRQVKATRLFYSLRSRILYGFKNASPVSAWVLLMISLALEPWSRLVLAAMRRSWGEARNTIEAYAMLLRELPAIMRRATRAEV